MLAARDRDALDTLSARLRATHGVEVEVVAADLLDPRHRVEVESRVADDERPIEILVNNAGFGLSLAFERNDIDDEVRHLQLHVEVPMRLTHAALGVMAARGHGRILNVASVAAFIPRSTARAGGGW